MSESCNKEEMKIPQETTEKVSTSSPQKEDINTADSKIASLPTTSSKDEKNNHDEKEKSEIEQRLEFIKQQKEMGPFFGRDNDVDNSNNDGFDFIATEESENYPGYTNKDVQEQVTFLSSVWDTINECFTEETKIVKWCLDNKYKQIEPSVWSGQWYFDKFPDKQPYTPPPIPSLQERINKNVNEEQFQQAKKRKDEGNRFFQRKKYKQAIQKYDEALQELGGENYTMFLNGDQRQEAIKIFSNKAECNIRLEKFNDASLDGSLALTLDKNHVKSLLRRARANYKIALKEKNFMGPDPFILGFFEEDVNRVIAMAGAGVNEAEDLLYVLSQELDPKTIEFCKNMRQSKSKKKAWKKRKAMKRK